MLEHRMVRVHGAKFTGNFLDASERCTMLQRLVGGDEDVEIFQEFFVRLRHALSFGPLLAQATDAKSTRQRRPDQAEKTVPGGKVRRQPSFQASRGECMDVRSKLGKIAQAVVIFLNRIPSCASR